MSEPREYQFSRRGFLAAAGAAAAAAGVVTTIGSPSAAGAATVRRGVGAVPRRAPSQSASDDLKIAMFAAGFEIVASRAYEKVLAAATAGSLGAVPAAGAEYAKTAQAQHRVQIDKWNEVITGAGQQPVIAPDATLDPMVMQEISQVTDFAGAAKLARDLEETAAATYLAVIPKLSDPAAIQLAGSIQIIDAQHVAILNYVLGEYPVPDVFAKTDKSVAPAA